MDVRGDEAGHVPFTRLATAAPWAGALLVAVAPWLLPGVGWVRPVAIALFLSLVVNRLAVAARAVTTPRRTPMRVMGVALTLFLTGSLVLSVAPGLLFPSPVEFLFGGAYVCFVWFLMVDANGGRAHDLRTALETAVVAGGIVSAAVFALAVPAAARLGLGGMPLLVALAYPVADLVLLAIVLTQLLIGRRVLDRRWIMLAGGLLVLAAVDISLPLGLGAGGYAFSSLQDLLWAVSLTALAESASRPAGPRPAAHRGTTVGIGPVVPVAAGLCALLVLVTGRGTAPVWMTHAPAALTIVLLLGLLLTSLHEARRGVEAQRLSRTDDLTGVGNRRAVMDVLLSSSGDRLWLVLIDLNGFKVINDTLGHQQGDRLLVGVAQRLVHLLKDADVVARLGGDEFAIVYRGATAATMTRRVEAVLTSMLRPLHVGELDLTASLSIGLAGDEDGRTAGIELLRRADVAMYRAKFAGGGYEWYDPASDTFSTDRLHLVEDLRTGLAEGQLHAHYQPQVRAADGTLAAVEALVRWQHPALGVLQPHDFLPLARKAGMMLALSIEVVNLTVAQAAAWVAAGTPLRVSINVDPPELLSGQWVPVLLAALERHRLDAALVTVEVTEELLISDFPRATASIRELAAHGIGVSIDDFGTGYSGLSWLQTLPVGELKLDRGFVSRVLSDGRTRQIVESTIELANALDIRVVVEGVEDAATGAALTGMGADLLQGFGVCAPLLPESLDVWRREQLAVSPAFIA